MIKCNGMWRVWAYHVWRTQFRKLSMQDFVPVVASRWQDGVKCFASKVANAGDSISDSSQVASEWNGEVREQVEFSCLGTKDSLKTMSKLLSCASPKRLNRASWLFLDPRDHFVRTPEVIPWGSLSMQCLNLFSIPTLVNRVPKVFA